jgi:hypothetical protein
MKASPALAAVMFLLGAGCTTTVQRTVDQSPAICGFLGADLCAERKPGARGKRACEDGHRPCRRAADLGK